MKLIDADALILWIEKEQKFCCDSKQYLGNLFWTGADVTYQKIYDHINDVINETD